MSARILFESDTPLTVSADRLVGDVLAELVPPERLSHAAIFLHARKLARDQKLADVKGFSPKRVFRIRERKFPQGVPAMSNVELRAKIVELEQRTSHYTAYEERILVDIIWKKDFVKDLLKAHPIILDEPALLNVMTDLSLMYAILAEENGFLHQHPSLIHVINKFFDDVVPDALKTMLSNTNPAVLRETVRAATTRNTEDAASRNLTTITPQMLQQALMSFNSGGAASNSSTNDATTSPPFAPVPAQPSVSPGLAAMNAALATARTEYAQQLAQLADYGFSNETENLQVLASVNGDIPAAIDLLMAMRHGDD